MVFIISVVAQVVKSLQVATGQASFPVKFWENYSPTDTHTFQDFLEQYAKYYVTLKAAQKKAMSLVFWDAIEKIGTPIIEDNLEKKGAFDVYFLYPKEHVVDDQDLYLQGDFHGYDTTDARSRVSEWSDTGVMLHRDTMPRDAILTYRYIQLAPSLRGKTPTEHHGS